MPLTSTAARGTPGVQRLFHGLAFVLDRGGENDLWAVGEVRHQGDPCGPTAGVDLEGEPLGVSSFAVREDDGERRAPEDGGLAGGEQDPGPGRRARHERLFVLVQNEDAITHVYAPFGGKVLLDKVHGQCFRRTLR